MGLIISMHVSTYIFIWNQGTVLFILVFFNTLIYIIIAATEIISHYHTAINLNPAFFTQVKIYPGSIYDLIRKCWYPPR